VIAALPADIWKSSRFYARLVFPGRIAELRAAAALDLQGRVVATDSYASAALLEYHLREPVVVFGRGTSHARQDDIDTDWRSLEGKAIVILRRELPAAGEYEPYFRSLETRRYALGGGVYHALIGTGFSYAAYRDGVLTQVRERYYRIPPRLPVGRCYFFERYFPG
jgi:hypothetical protein